MTKICDIKFDVQNEHVDGYHIYRNSIPGQPAWYEDPNNTMSVTDCVGRGNGRALCFLDAVSLSTRRAAVSNPVPHGTTSSFAVAFYVYIIENPANDSLLFFRPFGAPTDPFSFRIDVLQNRNCRYGIRRLDNPSVCTLYQGTAVLDVGEWIRIVVTFDSDIGIIKSYVGYSIDKTIETSGIYWGDGDTQWTIGNAGNGVDYSVCAIDDINIFDTADYVEKFLYGEADGNAGAAADLVVSLPLVGGADAHGGATAGIGALLVGGASGTASGTAGLGSALPLSGAADAHAGALATSTVMLPMAGSAGGHAGVAAGMGAALPLTGAAGGQAGGSAAQAVASPLVGGAGGSGGASGALAVASPLSGVAGGLAGGSASSAVSASLLGAAGGQAGASAASAVSVPLSGVADARAGGSATSSVASPLVGGAGGQAGGSAAPAVASPLTGGAGGFGGGAVSSASVGILPVFVRPQAAAYREPGYDYGIDVSTFPDDLDGSFALFGGPRVVLEAVARRLMTPRGSLLGSPDYGVDLRAWVNESVDEASLQNLKATIESQAQQDERVEAALADIAFDSTTFTMNIKVSVALTSGAVLKLVLSVDRVTVTLLQAA